MGRTRRAAPTPGRAVGYCRVSTTEQAAEGISLTAQQASVRAYAGLHGLVLVDVVVDAGVSASIPLADRPGGGRVVAMVAQGEVGAVIAVKLDRLFRDALDALSVTKHWDAGGIGLHLIDLRVDTSTAFGRMFLTMIAAIAEMERNLISERTAAALAHLRAEGVRVGRDGIGWTRSEERDEHGRRVVRAVPDETRVVRRMRALRRDGMTYASIAAALTEDGVPTKRGGRWRATTVRNAILREVGQRT